MVILLFLIVFLQGCRSPKPPVPEPPEPNPVEKTWEDYYPLNHYKPLIDLDKAKQTIETISSTIDLIDKNYQDLKNRIFDKTFSAACIQNFRYHF